MKQRRHGKRAIERKARQAKGWESGVKPSPRPKGIVGWPR